MKHVEGFDPKKIKGEYADEIWEMQDDGSEKIIEITEWKSNTITIGMAHLVTRLFKGDVGFDGIQYHALGHGDASWDVTVPEADYTDTVQYDEYFRKAPDSVEYVDDGGSPVVGPTSRLLITTTFDYGEATGSVREQSIFGGDATAALDSGLMLDVIRTKEIYKGATRKMIRRIRFTFGS